MPHVTVTETGTSKEGWIFRVVVDDATNHTVTVPKEYYDKIVRSTGSGQDGGMSPKELVKKSFAFLLAREPKEAILTAFELPVIQKYFSEYEQEMRR
jgi:hypothetical protein